MTLREAPSGHTISLVPGAKDALAGWTAILWREDGAVPPRVKELAFLRTSIVNDCKT
jgi:hypothetical protein